MSLSDAKSIKDYMTDPRRNDYLLRITYESNVPSKVIPTLSRLRSIFKQHSWAPIDIGDDMLSELMAGQNIMPEFRQVILSFRSKTNCLEEAYSDGVWKHRSDYITGG
jgi:hypothetical protein